VAAEASRPIGFGDARVGSATLAAAALVAQQVVGKALRDTLFLGSFGVEYLPYAMIGAAVLSAALVLALSRAAVSSSPRRVARATLLVSASLFLLAWLLSGPSPRGAAVVTYLHSAALSAASVSVFWSLVTESFDPYTARASVPRILAGATLGGVLGGLATWWAAGWLAPADLLPLGTVLNGVAWLGVSRLRGSRSRARPRPRDEAGWRPLIRELPFLRSVALLVFAAAVTQAILDYLLSSTAVASLGHGPPLLSFFALFQTAVGVLSFLVQVGVSRIALERFGVGAVLAAPPAAVLGGTLAALFAPPLLGTVIVRGADGVLGASLHRSAYEVLFAPVESSRRRAVKPLLDVLCDKLGLLLGGGIVAVVVALAPGSARLALLGVVVVVAVARVFLSSGLQAGYRRTLADNLRSGRLGLSGSGVLDRGTVGLLSRSAGGLDRAALLEQVERFRAAQARAPASEDGASWLSITAFDLPAPADLERSPEPPPDDVVAALGALRSGDPARVRAVLRRRRTEPLLAPQVVALLDDDRVAREAADWLSAQEPPPVGLLTDALLADGGSDHLRRRVARLLGKFDDPRAAEGLLAALSVVPSGVRSGLAHALARTSAKRPLPREPLLTAATRAAADGTGVDDYAHLMDIFRLLAAAYPGEPMQPALRALERGGDARGTALEWLDVLLPHEVKEALWPRIVRSGERIASTRDAEELRQALRRH
jgi:AAA family ATP:ADP antiporter